MGIDDDCNEEVFGDFKFAEDELFTPSMGAHLELKCAGKQKTLAFCCIYHP
jgi:hypothetical protein